jgi:hypothetical protein
MWYDVIPHCFVNEIPIDRTQHTVIASAVRNGAYDEENFLRLTPRTPYYLAAVAAPGA